MITARVCDRCGEPVRAGCPTVTRDDGYHVLTNDLCDRCMNELYAWFNVDPEEVLDARKTPLERYTEKLREDLSSGRTLGDAIGEVPEGMIVILPYGGSGLIVYSGRSMTLHGSNELCYSNYGRTCSIQRAKDVDGGSCVCMGIGGSVEHMSFESEGRGGMVVNAKQLGRRLPENE